MPTAILGAGRQDYVDSKRNFTKYGIGVFVTGASPTSQFTFGLKYGLTGRPLNRTIPFDQFVDKNSGGFPTKARVEFDFDPRYKYDLQATVIETLNSGSSITYTSNIITISTITQPDAPQPPSASIIEIDGMPKIKLTWLGLTKWGWGGGDPFSYYIEYFSPQDNPPIRRIKTLNVFGGGYPEFMNYVVEGLTPGKDYIFRLAAQTYDPGHFIPLSAFSLESRPIHLPLLPAPLFNKFSWAGSNMTNTQMNALNKAADRWSNLIKIGDTERKAILDMFPQYASKFINGIFLKKITYINDPNKSAVACVPHSVVEISRDKSGKDGVVTVCFSMRINTYYNTSSFTDYDWELAFTHQLGHALGLGFVEGESYYPRYRLSGEQFPDAQRAYNELRNEWLAVRNLPRVFKRKYIPVDHIGPIKTDDLVGFDGTQSVFVDDDKASSNGEIYTGSPYWHWGLIRYSNPDNKASYLHPTVHINNDIMSYRYPNQDKAIGLLSIKALVDMGYSEIKPNKSENPQSPVPPTTITNKQLCCNLNSGTTGNGDVVALSLDPVDDNPIVIGSISKNSLVSYLEPEESNPCAKWYCSESGCVQINSFEFFGDGTLYDSLEECEADCTDSAGILSSQFIFDTQSKTWRNK